MSDVKDEVYWQGVIPVEPAPHYHADLNPCQRYTWNQGAAAERARIVAYLREMGDDDAANEIERGDHLGAKPSP